MTSMPAECAACISEKYGYEFQVRSALYSPVEYIQRKRLFNAAKLLTDTDKLITDIALSCGFSNPSYFSKQLRELDGPHSQRIPDYGQGTAGYFLLLSCYMVQ